MWKYAKQKDIYLVDLKACTVELYAAIHLSNTCIYFNLCNSLPDKEHSLMYYVP